MTTPPAAGSSARPLVAHRFLVALLRSPFARLIGGMCELRFTGRVSGRTIALPVQCAQEETRLVITVGHASGKRWWRNFIDGHDVQVRLGGVRYQGRGRVLDVHHPDRGWAERSYRRCHPGVEVARTDPIVLIDLEP